MRWQAIILDRDGTLFDSLPLILKAFNYGIEPFSIRKPTREEWFAAFGPAEPEVMGAFVLPEHKTEAFQRFYHYYTKHFDEIRLFPGMLPFLKRLKKAGVKLSLFTGGGRTSTVYCLKQHGILDYFDDMVCGDELKKPKPDPEGILKTISVLKVDPVATMVVGDSGADILAGKAAGTFTALARWAEAAPLYDLSVQPDKIFHSVEEMERFVFSANE